MYAYGTRWPCAYCGLPQSNPNRETCSASCASKLGWKSRRKFQNFKMSFRNNTMYYPGATVTSERNTYIAKAEQELKAEMYNQFNVYRTTAMNPNSFALVTSLTY